MADKLTYAAVIVSHGITESKNSHTPEVQIRVQTTRCLTTDVPIIKNLTVDLWLTDKCAQRTMDSIRAIGFQGNDLEEMNQGVLVDAECEVTTKFEYYNGQPREKVTWINAKGNFASRGFKPLDPAKNKALTSSFNQLLRTTKKQAPATKAKREEAKAIESKMESLGADSNAAEEDPPF